MAIVQDIVKNMYDTLNYEIEGVRRRWERRIQLINKLKQLHPLKNIKQRLLGQVYITKHGKVHYDYEPVITKHAILY